MKVYLTDSLTLSLAMSFDGICYKGSPFGRQTCRRALSGYFTLLLRSPLGVTCFLAGAREQLCRMNFPFALASLLGEAVPAG
ncbi:hypothetical protein [Dendronalium sp. ChiSLP03b]|uniref:hypothetical protein n=1 Tax=Dendronalium sp. ChiSLP03b TaxID=3075381 RepID=UPI002AD32CB5|nr:hypothetical protein [Dendronalium sp. ChiSLP03b]MDZ8203862.1 hypothetical protein [Dendronalium sp. ChiSLP03b]